MAVTLNIQADVKAATRKLTRVQRRVIPKATLTALNKTATSQRNVGLKAVAKELNLPQRNVTARLDKNGKKKGDRARVTNKATKNKLISEISVYERGIPVIQLTTRAQKVRASIKARKGGIKAKGGRTYKTSFIAEAKGGNVQVFARRKSTRNRQGRLKLFVPKVGVHDAIVKAYAKVMKTTGLSVFRKRFDEQLRYELSKIQ